MASFNNKAEMSALEVSILFCFSQSVQFSDKVSFAKSFYNLISECFNKNCCILEKAEIEDDYCAISQKFNSIYV